MFPLGFPFWFEVDRRDERWPFVKVQLEVPAAKPLEEILFRVIAEPVELRLGELGDLMERDDNPALEFHQQSEIDPAVDLLKTRVQLCWRGIPTQLAAKLGFVIISKSLFYPQGIENRNRLVKN